MKIRKVETAEPKKTKKIRIGKATPVKVETTPPEERCEVRGCRKRGICCWHPQIKRWIDRRV